MIRDINDVVAKSINAVMYICRLPLLKSTSVYALEGLPALQRTWERFARRRAVTAFRDARRRCPAYAKFLNERGVTSGFTRLTFSSIPETTKQNYVKMYSIEDRCFNGTIPTKGVVIDESSGSSGTANNWVRGPGERASVRRLIGHGFGLTFGDRQIFLVNCFALGPWATGMNVTMSMVEKTIVKSVGPDKVKLENTLKVFGPRYEYVIAGYPPFIKDFLDTTSLDLAAYNLHLLVGGEGITEALRDRFLKQFKSVYSSYGASDLEINIAAESPMSIAVRRLCVRDVELCRAVFGRDEPPMLFQFDPLDYLIESNREHELLYTLLRPGYAAPKIRYNLRDVGGVIPYRQLIEILTKHKIDPSTLPRALAFPFMFVSGRSDLTVVFYGAKIFSSDLDSVLHSEPELQSLFYSFQMRVRHDDGLADHLVIALERPQQGERTGVVEAGKEEIAKIRDALIRGLKRVNQDFREVSKMFSDEQVVVEVHASGSGPFAMRDIRVKHQYVG